MVPGNRRCDRRADTMRRNRNRTAVITALLEMIREGDLHPGAAEIADRAGVSHRSIFRYFDDLDDLVRTAIDQAFQDAAPLSTIPDRVPRPSEHRIADLVDERLALFTTTSMAPCSSPECAPIPSPRSTRRSPWSPRSSGCRSANSSRPSCALLPQSERDVHRRRCPRTHELRRLHDPHPIAGEHDRQDPSGMDHRADGTAEHLSFAHRPR